MCGHDSTRLASLELRRPSRCVISTPECISRVEKSSLGWRRRGTPFLLRDGCSPILKPHSPHIESSGAKGSLSFLSRWKEESIWVDTHSSGVILGLSSDNRDAEWRFVRRG